MLKKAKQSWKDNFDKVLSSSESKEFAKVRKYYDDQYRQAIDEFLKMNKTTGFDNLFRVADIADIYSQIYVNIGVKFAKWYAKNFDKVVSKQTDVSGYTDIWAERFNNVSQQIAAERVTLVSGTAKATLVKVFKRLSSDPEFMVMNEREASRILRQKFGQYSKSQAERLVRTEATNAANFATLQSATDMFGQDNLQKEWMTALDGRERPAHRAADGQIVDFKGRFKVGGELLFNPGDPAGSAKNVVNCRCSTAPFPKPDAQAAGTIEGFGVRPPVSIPGTKPPKPPTGSVLRTPKPVREPVREVVEEVKPKKPQFYPEELDKMIDDGYLIENTDYLNLLTEPVNLIRTNGGSVHQGGVIKIGVKRYKKGSNMINKVLSHEYGHAIHNQRNWAVYNPFNKRNPVVDPTVKKYFDKWQKMLGHRKGRETQLAVRNKYHKGKLEFDIDRLKKEFPNLSQKEILEHHGSMADFFGALTKNRLGYGHSINYYNVRGIYGQYAEVIAHTFENYYFKNPIFKKYFPELFEDTKQLMRELIKQTNGI
ncbi:hypothetical protein [uncultured Mediterranean phage uvMED]|nr:hypothetical protein [uncultured Mediterranean phage uvMED]